MDRPHVTVTSLPRPTAESSMRVLEYATCVLAVVAAFLLGFVH